MPKPVTVSFSLGRTINLGNFENVKIEVGIDVHTDTDKLEADYEKARRWVEKKLAEEEDKWDDQKK